MAPAEEADDLVERASRGDPIAVEEMLQEELPRLQAFVRLRMGSVLRAKEESADLVQSICRVILTHKGQFVHEGPQQFRRWLFTTAQRVVADKVKYWKRDRRDARRERSPELEDHEVSSLSNAFGTLLTPSRVVSARERLEQFQRAFDALPEDHREVISLARVLELPHKEVAEQMGRSEAATRTLLHRALAALSAALDTA